MSLEHLRRTPAGLFVATALCAVFSFGTRAAELNTVQSGTTTITSGSTSTNVTITAVNTSASFLVFSARVSNENPGVGQVSGQITNSTTLTFERATTGADVNISWYVAEFSSGVSVQRGSTNANLTTSVSIGAVDLARAFPMITHRTPGTVFNNDDYVQAKLTSSTNLDLILTTNSNVNAAVEWQVVEWDAAVVQSGDLAFASGTGLLTANPSAVDPTKSWLIYSYSSASGTTANIGQKLVRGLITDGTTLTFDRDNTGQAFDVTWYLVEFTDATTVQHGSANFPTSTGVQNVAISTIDPTKSLAASGHYQRGGKSPYSGGDNPGVAWVTCELSSNTLTLTRDFTGSSADIGYSVVTFDTPNTGPPVVTNTIPDTTVAEDQSLDDYRILSGVFNDPDEGGALTYTIESNSNPGLVTPSIDLGDGLDLALVPDQSGSSTIVVRATDSGGLFVEDTFVLDVTPVNDAPRVAFPMPDTSTVEGAPAIVGYRDLNVVFNDPEEGGNLGFLELGNTNPALVTTTFGADSTIGFTFATGLSGVARIIVGAFDSSFLLGRDTLYVTVVDLGEWPTVVAAIPDTTVNTDIPPFTFRDLNQVFSDFEDGNQLTFSIMSNSNPALVTVTVDADSALDVAVAAAQMGSADIVIRAVDSASLWVEDTFKITVTPAPTGVGDDVPQRTALLQNYPNPFNPTTTIRYDLAAPVPVTLRIYDLRGREVRTLVDAHQTAGPASVTWDGKNNAGARVSSGVYFYRLTAGDYSASKRLVLLQ